MKKNLVLVIALLSIFSCGKNDKSSPTSPAIPEIESKQVIDMKDSLQSNLKVKASDINDINETSNEPFNLKNSYSGKMLMLIYPHPSDWGWIRIGDDKDSLVLYKALQIKETHSAGNLVWNDTKIKNAANIACYEQSLIKKPKEILHTCSLFINYSTGSINEISDKSDADTSVPKLDKSYLSDTLKIDIANQDKIALINLKGKDAKALFSTLYTDVVEEKTELSNLRTKKGKHISCTESVAIEEKHLTEYNCSFSIDYTTGKAISLK